MSDERVVPVSVAGPELMDTAEARFGVSLVTGETSRDQVTMTMPYGALRHPDTGRDARGLLTLVADSVAGLANYLYLGCEKMTVTSEMSVVYAPAATLGAADIRAQAHTVFTDELTAVSQGEMFIGAAKVAVIDLRSFFGPLPDGPLTESRQDRLSEDQRRSLYAMLSLGTTTDTDDGCVLSAVPDVALHNGLGSIHGGVVSTCLEVAAVAALARRHPQSAMVTGSIRVNYLRPMLAGNDSRFVARIVRVGRSTALVDVEAIGADGKVAATARVTSYTPLTG